MGAAGCRHYLVVSVGVGSRDGLATCQGIVDGLVTACTGLPEVAELSVERNRVSGPGQADVILCTTFATANDLVRVRGTVLRECIEQLRQHFPDFEIRELSAMS